MHSLLIITKEEYFKLNLVLNASASATAEALPVAHLRDTSVSYRPHQPPSFFSVPSRLKTLFSRVQGARKPVPGQNPSCSPTSIEKFSSTGGQMGPFSYLLFF